MADDKKRQMDARLAEVWGNAPTDLGEIPHVTLVRPLRGAHVVTIEQAKIAAKKQHEVSRRVFSDVSLKA